MKRKFNIHAIIVLLFGIFLFALSFNSCIREDEVSIKEPDRYTHKDVKSYADLFKVFWTVMDQRYNYFYEQKRRDGMNWDALYKEYYSKFLALESFGRVGFSDKKVREDADKAIEYFTNIIDPIIDRHFYVKIRMPYSSNTDFTISKLFFGGMKNNLHKNSYDFITRYSHMKNRLGTNAIKMDSVLMSGTLISNPDIHYFSFSEFNLSRKFKLDLHDKYLSPELGDKYLLTVKEIEESEALNSIKNVTLRDNIKNKTIEILNEWNSFSSSNEMRDFNEQVSKFNKTEILSDEFLSATQKALMESRKLINYRNAVIAAYRSYQETYPYIRWFVSRMDTHSQYGYRLPIFQKMAQEIIKKSNFYRQFLNPLHRGEIKKIIIDFRGNGGGQVLDARFFTDRFITKSVVSNYQRVKEGNGRFNYTPWVPVHVKPHKFGIPSDIPIAILIDGGSASMSEISTMMIKSQGDHVIVIGDYSAGATAGLGGSDDFNGGIRDRVAGYFEFYMPLMANKDAKGEVIEGIGIKPDIHIDSPSRKELQNPVFVDKAMQEAIKYLSSK